MLQRILVVGLGSIGRRHARIARQLLPDAEIFALRHADCSGVNEPGIDRCFTRLEDALGSGIQAAVIANPATHHLETALTLAEAGVHLLIEKPIANSSQGVSELIEISRTRGSVLMTGYNLRFLPSLQRFRELLHQDRIGRVLSVRAEVGQFLPGWRPGSDYRQSVSAQAALGGGVLLELSHDIDYLRWIFGEVTWVSAILSKQSSLEIDVEDTAFLVLGFRREGEGAPIPASLNMDFVRQDSTRGCTVIGESGSLRWNAITGVVDVFEAGGSEWIPIDVYPPHRDESYLAEWKHFLACIEGDGRAAVSGADGLAALHIVEAARRSSDTGTVVRMTQA